MKADATSAKCMSQLFYEQLRGLSEEGRLSLEGLTPESLLQAWLEKESEFTYLEDARVPKAPEVASKISCALKRVERMMSELRRVGEARVADDLEQLPEGFACATRTLDELDWVETLYEEELIPEDDVRLLRHVLEGARALKRAFIARFVEAEGVDLSLAYERSSLLSAEERASAYVIEGPWVARQALISPPLKRLDSWRSLLGEGVLERAFDALQDDLNALEASHREVWTSAADALTAEGAPTLPTPLWVEHIAPVASEWALNDLQEALYSAAAEDVADVFEPLACAPRPKDHRVGALSFSGEGEREVTVIFTKRDGHILAQRDLTWEPTTLEGVVADFEEIKIRTLVAPDVVPAHVEEALKALSQRYELAKVSDVATTEVTRPQHLSSAAQRAFQLAQRFVAPLRFWARCDPLSFAAEVLPPELFDQLSEEPTRRARLKAALKARVDARWVALRRERELRHQEQHKGAPRHATHPQHPQHSQHSQGVKEGKAGKEGNTTASLRRGDLVEVELSEVEGVRLKGHIISEAQRGRAVMITLSGSRALMNRTFEVGERLEAHVILDHPQQPYASLTLRSLSAQPSEHEPQHPQQAPLGATQRRSTRPTRRHAQGYAQRPLPERSAESKGSLSAKEPSGEPSSSKQTSAKSSKSAERESLNKLNSLFAPKSPHSPSAKSPKSPKSRKRH